MRKTRENSKKAQEHSLISRRILKSRSKDENTKRERKRVLTENVWGKIYVKSNIEKRGKFKQRDRIMVFLIHNNTLSLKC